MEFEWSLIPPISKTPLPLYRQVPGKNRMAQIVNALSLARRIIQTREEDTPEYLWAKMILTALDH